MNSFVIRSAPLRKIFPIFTMLLLCASHITKGGDSLSDSLEVKLILLDDKQKLPVLDKLIPLYFRNHPLLAEKHSQRQLKLAKKLHDKYYEIHALRNLGLSYKYLVSDYDKALEYCLEAKTKSEQAHLGKELIETHLAIASIYNDIGNNYKALEYQIEAMQHAEKYEEKQFLPVILGGQATTYINLADYQMAESCLRRAQNYLDTEGQNTEEQKLQEGELLTIYGRYHHQLNNQKLCLDKYLKAYEVYNSLGDQFLIAKSLYNIGECYRSMEKYEKAMEYHIKALELRRFLEDQTGLAESFNKIGALCIDIKQYDRAINNLQLGLKNAQMVNSNKLMQESYNFLYFAYINLNEFSKAYYYKDKFAAISELIYTEASERKIAELTTKYEIGRREQEIKYLEDKFLMQQKELEKGKIYNITLIFLLVILITFGGYIFYSYRDKRKINNQLKIINKKVVRQNSQLKELNSTKDKFFSIIAHDLKGPLNSLTSFSQLLINHTSAMTREEIKSVASDLDKSLKGLYELLENLLAWSRSQTGKMEIKPEPFKINDVLKESVQLLTKAAKDKDIEVKLAFGDEIEVFADKNAIKTVARNLISNAIKFTNQGGRVEVFAEEWKDAVEIGVKDNGVGMSKEYQKHLFDISVKHTTKGTNNETGTGLGLILCKEFIEFNGGALYVVSEEGKGSVFKFSLPRHADSLVDA